MPVNELKYEEIVKQLQAKDVTLIAVSKTKPVEDIAALHQLGQVDFGENYVQELTAKHEQLQSKNIRWHFIGHLQSNKVKYIAPFVHLIHSVDSLKLLKEINKQAAKSNRVVDCLLQVYIAQEETKFGMDEAELYEVINHLDELKNTRVKGLMGMATLTGDDDQVRNEYRRLKGLFDTLVAAQKVPASFDTISMGMSSDFRIAIEEGSTMVRIGSLLFGERNYPPR